MTVLDRLNEVFREVFDDDSLQVVPQMTANDIDGWDSLSHINLIMAVESEFNIRFGQKELLGLRNVGDLFRQIELKVA